MYKTKLKAKAECKSSKRALSGGGEDRQTKESIGTKARAMPAHFPILQRPSTALLAKGKQHSLPALLHNLVLLWTPQPSFSLSRSKRMAMVLTTSRASSYLWNVLPPFKFFLNSSSLKSPCWSELLLLKVHFFMAFFHHGTMSLSYVFKFIHFASLFCLVSRILTWCKVNDFIHCSMFLFKMCVRTVNMPNLILTN